jgi:hypothetical protein
MISRSAALPLSEWRRSPLGKLSALSLGLRDDVDSHGLPDDLWRQREGRAEIIDCLETLYELCAVEATPRAFANGVTDSTGTIDEGEVRAGERLDEARRLIARLLRGEWTK